LNYCEENGSTKIILHMRGRDFPLLAIMNVIITCSGLSNTGKLTTQTAQILLQRKPGHYVWIAARLSVAALEAEIRDADGIIVIDGCSDCCAKKKLSASCIEPHCHIVATDIGIVKNGRADVKFEEIEKMVTSVMNNEERREN
jgi:uncharacterized metal-binding protein